MLKANSEYSTMEQLIWWKITWLSKWMHMNSGACSELAESHHNHNYDYSLIWKDACNIMVKRQETKWHLCWNYQNTHAHAPQLLENQYKWLVGWRTVADRNHFPFCYCYSELCATSGDGEGLKEASVSLQAASDNVLPYGASQGSSREDCALGPEEIPEIQT